MRILILTIGSHGDVHPFIGLGLALRGRGHDVKVIVNPFFSDLLQKAGLDMIPLGSAEEFKTVCDNPDLWHRKKGFPLVFNTVLDGLEPAYRAIANHILPGETIVVASSLGLAARIAQEKLNVPTVTVHLAPAIFRSSIEPPRLPGLFMPGWLPRPLKKMLFALGDRFVIDPLIAPRLNAFRATLGLKQPVWRIMQSWWNSPQRVIGLFPEWFAKSQADWPPQVRLTGFPLYDEREISRCSEQLTEFLKAGDPPIVFTPGSAMQHAHEFFEQSAAACQQLGKRAIFLSRHVGHIPENLPDGIRHFDYAPFSQLLPHTAAFIHHGGIGTSAQAMKAGVKQIIVPFCHDQLDNAHRMNQLGIAKTLHPKRHSAARLAALLREVLADGSMQSACKKVAEYFVGANPIDQTCELIEGVK